MKLPCPWLSCAAAIAASLPTLQAGENGVNFSKDIQPIFQKTCVECHGPEKQKGKLRLDLKAEAFKDTSVLVPGKADQSELYRRITLPPGHDDFMPAKGEPLTKEQTDRIRDWINQGAAWPDDPVMKPAEPAGALPDPRPTLQPSPAEQNAITQLKELGVPIRPVAMNVTWTQASFRGLDSNVVDKALPLLAPVLTLEDLNLAGLALRDEQLQHIAGLTNLTRLHLEKTAITDAGLTHLKGLVNLRYLNLYQTSVSDAGLAHLQPLKQLRHLYLWQTKVTSAGAQNLQTALGQTEINRGWEMSAAQAEQKSEPKKEGEKAEPK